MRLFVLTCFESWFLREVFLLEGRLSFSAFLPMRTAHSQHDFLREDVCPLHTVRKLFFFLEPWSFWSFFGLAQSSHRTVNISSTTIAMCNAKKPLPGNDDDEDFMTTLVAGFRK